MTAKKRRLLGIALLAIGVTLSVIAFVISVGDSTASGDAGAVEDALRSATTPSPPVEATGEEPPATPEPTAAVPEPTSEEETDRALAPETPPDAPLPTALRIDALGVDAPVLPFGVDELGQMDVPDNVTDVAWYEYGPRPGEEGSAVLAAHVDLAGQGPGVFFDLRTLEVGDNVTVVNADGSEEDFRVVARVVYEKGDLPLDVIFARQGPPVLTLITCGGDFNSRILSYDSNVVVYAVPQGAAEIPFGSTA